MKQKIKVNPSHQAARPPADSHQERREQKMDEEAKTDLSLSFFPLRDLYGQQTAKNSSLASVCKCLFPLLPSILSKNLINFHKMIRFLNQMCLGKLISFIALGTD